LDEAKRNRLFYVRQNFPQKIWFSFFCGRINEVFSFSKATICYLGVGGRGYQSSL